MSEAAGDKRPEFPAWCDLKCSFAEFPKEEGVDGSGSCRTFLALHCNYLDELVTKNAPCAARLRGPAE